LSPEKILTHKFIEEAEQKKERSTSNPSKLGQAKWRENIL
jgi:hypothetical protein